MRGARRLRAGSAWTKAPACRCVASRPAACDIGAAGRSWWGCRSGSGRCGPARPVGGFEQLDEVTGGVSQQNLASGGADDHIAAERQPGAAQPVDHGIEVVDYQMDAVIAAAGDVVRGGAGTRAGGSGEQQPQGTRRDFGEGGCGAAAQGEPEMGGVEVNGRLDVVNEVADTGELVGYRHG